MQKPKVTLLVCFAWFMLLGLEGLFPPSVSGQLPYFSRQYSINGNNCKSQSLVIGDSLIYVGGDTRNIQGLRECFLMALDSAGNEVWKKSYGAPKQNWFIGKFGSTIALPNGDLLQAGILQDSLKQTAHLIRYNALGDTLWTRRYFTDRSSSLRNLTLLKNGNIAACAYVDSTTIPWVLILDNSGNVLARHTVNSLSFQFNYIVATQDGGWAVGGVNSGNGGDPMIVRFDSNGNHIWTRVANLNSSTTDCPAMLIPTPDSGFIASSCYVDSSGPFHPATSRPTIWKLDAQNQTEWEKSYPPSSLNHQNFGLFALRGGNFIMINAFQDAIDNQRTFVTKVDPNGNVIWETDHWRSRILQEMSHLYSLKEDKDGSLVLAGFTFRPHTQPGNRDNIWATRLDSNGCGNAAKIKNLSAVAKPATFGSGIELNWQDSIPGHRYYIERLGLNPFEDWKEIAQDWAGTTLLDTNLFLNSQYCYRIRAVDNQGGISCLSDTICAYTLVSADEKLAEQGLSTRIHPNPTDEAIGVYLQGEFLRKRGKQLRLEICDLRGKRLLHKQLMTLGLDAQQADLDLSQLAAGAYLLQVWVGSELLSTDKLLKQ